jgi:hypothetical protein
MAVAITTEAGFSAGAPKVAVQGDYDLTPAGIFGRPFDVSPDGRRFLMTKDAGGDDARRLVVIVNGLRGRAEP